MMLEEPEYLAEDSNALSLMQCVSKDMTPQDMFQVTRSGNQDNLSFNTGDACETESYYSVLNNSAATSMVEHSLLVGSGESTLDWMDKNMNFETEDILNQPLEFPEYLDLNRDHPLKFSIPCAHTGLQLDSDHKPSSSFSENSVIVDLAPSPELHFSPSNKTESEDWEIHVDLAHSPELNLSPSNQTESEDGEVHNPEDSFCNDSIHGSSSKRICTTPGEKYLEMRRKNNISSQQSRKKRKIKDSEMTEKLAKLETENKRLLILAENLEKKRDALQKCLLDAIARK